VKTDGEDGYATGDALQLVLPEERIHRFRADGRSIR
jgi:hypothetical protein